MSIGAGSRRDRRGRAMHALMRELFPICRSITGDGVRETLAAVARRIPLEVHEVPSGTQVLDWTVPDEWNIRDAYIAPDGRRVVDFRESNLHVVSYSEPSGRRCRSTSSGRTCTRSRAARLDPVPHVVLRADLGLLPRAATLDALEDGDVRGRHRQHARAGLAHVRRVLPAGRARGGGPAHDARLPPVARERQPLRHRAADRARRAARRRAALALVPAPLHPRDDRLDHVARAERGRALDGSSAGLVVACVGDSAPLTYKRSRRGDAAIDRAAAYVLRARTRRQVVDFVPWGWDERQFNSPGFDLPVGCLSRSREGEFPEYHSSADDLDLVRPEPLEEALAGRPRDPRRPRDRPPLREPRPEGRAAARPARPLPDRSAEPAAEEEQLAMLWVLNQSDGGTRCSTSPSARGFRSRAIRDAATGCSRPGSSRRADGRDRDRPRRRSMRRDGRQQRDRPRRCALALAQSRAHACGRSATEPRHARRARD